MNGRDVGGSRLYDVIVVGSGATGGWAAKELTEKGLAVCLLEAGENTHEVSSAGGARPDFASQRTCRQPAQSSCYAYSPRTRQYFVDDEDNPYTTPSETPFAWIRGRQLGGRTQTWAGQCYRLGDLELKAATMDGYGSDWPISYEDIAPYYEKVERFLRVTGTIEQVPHLPNGYFLPPGPLSAGEMRVRDAVTARWADRTAVIGRLASYTADRHGRKRFCTSSDSTLVAAAMTGRLTLHLKAIARRVLLEEKTDKAVGVSYVNGATKKAHEVFARVVVLCASTIESTRLLLNSACSAHPNGMANSSGLLGCYLMDHITVRLRATASFGSRNSRDPDEWSTNGLYIPRFRNIRERAADFLRGYGIQCEAHAVPEGMKTLLGYDRRERVYALWMSLFGEMLPRHHNRVTVNPAVRDALGIPVAHIECSHSDNELALAADGIEAMREMAVAAGFRIIDKCPRPGLPGAGIHEVGTARMGNDPKTSVLNRFNQSWDVRNLFITDGSCFVSQGSQHPSLTMMALTVRACDFIAHEMRRGSL